MITKSTLFALIPGAAALAAGAVLPFQAASNAAVGRAMGSPVWGAMTSLVVSAIVILMTAVVLRTPSPNVGNAVSGPWWLWIGGVLGAVYVGAAASVTPRLGAGGFLVLVVAGQMIAAVIADHMGLMGLSPKPINLTRVAGVVLILIGAVAVHLGGQTSQQA